MLLCTVIFVGEKVAVRSDQTWTLDEVQNMRQQVLPGMILIWNASIPELLYAAREWVVEFDLKQANMLR